MSEKRKREYHSGHWKRSRQAEREKSIKNLNAAMQKFLIPKEKILPKETIIEANTATDASDHQAKNSQDSVLNPHMEAATGNNILTTEPPNTPSVSSELSDIPVSSMNLSNNIDNISDVPFSSISASNSTSKIFDLTIEPSNSESVSSESSDIPVLSGTSSNNTDKISGVPFSSISSSNTTKMFDISSISDNLNKNNNIHDVPSCTSDNTDNLSFINASTNFFYNDPALWPPVTDTLREHFILNTPSQNIEHLGSSKQTISGKKRMCTESNFFRIKKNGEKVQRDWLVYSPSAKAVFCYVCKLYSSNDQALSKNGFSDWRNLAKRLSSHENSSFHRESVYFFSQRSAVSGRIDSSLVEQHKSECLYWKKVLHRIVAVIRFISQRGLPFFGTNEIFGSVNNGNFLGILELLSTFDTFLAEHINMYGNKGKGSVSYLSSTIVAEFIELMSRKVLQEILTEIKHAKYFGLILDSTPDITHVDQLSLVLRYVDIQGDPVERFVKFIPIHGHSAQHLQEVVVNVLGDLGIDLQYCRGQSYDNASNMAGKYSGLQARLKKDFPLIEYVPCTAHSLNLVGASAAECCNEAVSFFGLIQSLYNFFSASTHRWELLSKNLTTNLTLKSLATTRWSANADAVNVLSKQYKNILDVLSSISNDPIETASTRNEAENLFSKIETFEFVLMLVIWDTILKRINSVNKTIQSINCELSAVVPLYESLESFINYVRGNFEDYEKEAENLAGTKIYSIKRKRVTPKSKMLDESASVEVQLTDRERFVYKTHYVICDAIITELSKRKNAYSALESRFGFMCSRNKTTEQVKISAKNLAEIYSDDIDEDFPDEFLQFNDFLSEDLKTHEKLKMIKSLGIGHTFPNVETALRVMLSVPITNCSSERSFSALKLIKNRLRSSISEKNLSGLSLLTIESDLTGKICFDDIIEQFASAKSRKKPI